MGQKGCGAWWCERASRGGDGERCTPYVRITNNPAGLRYTGPKRRRRGRREFHSTRKTYTRIRLARNKLSNEAVENGAIEVATKGWTSNGKLKLRWSSGLDMAEPSESAKDERARCEVHSIASTVRGSMDETPWVCHPTPPPPPPPPPHPTNTPPASFPFRRRRIRRAVSLLPRRRNAAPIWATALSFALPSTWVFFCAARWLSSAPARV